MPSFCYITWWHRACLLCALSNCHPSFQIWVSFQHLCLVISKSWNDSKNSSNVNCFAGVTAPETPSCFFPQHVFCCLRWWVWACFPCWQSWVSQVATAPTFPPSALSPTAPFHEIWIYLPMLSLVFVVPNSLFWSFTFVKRYMGL